VGEMDACEFGMLGNTTLLWQLSSQRTLTTFGIAGEKGALGGGEGDVQIVEEYIL
jgi:hypothetical protein